MTTRRRASQRDGTDAVESTRVLPRADERDAYLPLKDLATYSGLGVRTLRNYLSRAAHPLPCYRVGGRVLVRRSEFDSWMARFKQVTVDRVDALVADVVRRL